MTYLPEVGQLRQLLTREVDGTRRQLLAGLVSVAALPRAAALRAAPSSGVRTALVIGAGIAGLSAAYELQKAGFHTRVFEKWDFTGGRMREAWMGPLYGPPHALGVFDSSRELFDLGAELGISEGLAGGGISDSGQIDNGHGKYTSALRFRIKEVAAIPGLSAATRRKLSLLQPDLDEIGSCVDPCQLASGHAYDDESIHDYYHRQLGRDAAREVLDYWVDVVLAAWGWPAKETSRIAILSWFAQQDSEVRTPRDGIGVLTRQLASVLPVETRTTVRYITPPDANGRHTVHYLTPELTRASMTPDVVVVATEGKYIPSLVQGLDQRDQAFFRSIDCTKAVSVSYVLSAADAPSAPIFGSYTPRHPDPIKRRVASWSVSPASPSDHDRPPVASIYLSREEFFEWQRSGSTVQEYCLPLLAHFYPQIERADIVDTVNRTYDDLIYMPVGYVREMHRLLSKQGATRRGLYFAGEYVAGAHTGAACASGRNVARTIVRHWA